MCIMIDKRMCIRIVRANLTLCRPGYLTCFLSFADFFQTTSLRNTIRVSNGLDPDQARRSVGPDLGPNCLHFRLSADGNGR